jgi:hypothetical protein
VSLASTRGLDMSLNRSCPGRRTSSACRRLCSISYSSSSIKPLTDPPRCLRGSSEAPSCPHLAPRNPTARYGNRNPSVNAFRPVYGTSPSSSPSKRCVSRPSSLQAEILLRRGPSSPRKTRYSTCTSSCSSRATISHRNSPSWRSGTSPFGQCQSCAFRGRCCSSRCHQSLHLQHRDTTEDQKRR